jgi:hypothetical protein
VAVGNLQLYEYGLEPHPTQPLRVPAVTMGQQTVVTGAILKRRSVVLKSGIKLIESTATNQKSLKTLLAV